MNLADALLPLLPGAPGVVAFVGAGGKTTALFRLARELAETGASVLATTTTHLADPRLAPGGAPGDLVFRADLEGPCTGGPVPEGRPGLTILLAREAGGGKVKGIHPSWVPSLKAAWDFVLVEADGSRGLPVKAPAAHEPVIPPATDLVVGLVGLDCLGRPMDGATVHRPERFTEVTGCAPGAPISWDALAALARHPLGLFKGSGSARAVLLNKADRLPVPPTPAQLGALEAHQVLVCSLAAGNGGIVCLREVRS